MIYVYDVKVLEEEDYSYNDKLNMNALQIEVTTIRQ